MKKKNLLVLIFAGIFVVIIAFVLVFNRTSVPVTPVQDVASDSIHVPAPTPKLFGIEVDTFNVVSDEVKSGDSFGKITGSLGLGTASIYAVAEQVKDVFDVTRIKSGKRYTVLTGKGSSQPSFFIYEASLLNYYVVSLKDSVYAFEGERKRTVAQKQVREVINSSLSASLNNNALTDELASIYAWSIDFFRIQKGDSILVAYEEIYVDDTIYAGIGDIKYARFKHFGENYYAFRYTDESGLTEYYDETGHSLRKAFLKAPLKFSRISSRYTMKRFHPVQKRWKAHLGTDYAAPRGTPIMSTADGVVERAGYTSGNGNYVKIRHNSVYSTQYLHMSKFAKGMKKGKRVRQGDIIGYVGSTGLATGPHVCYRFWKNGKQVDPYRQKLPDANPIDEKYKAAFLKFIEEPLMELANLLRTKPKSIDV